LLGVLFYNRVRVTILSIFRYFKFFVYIILDKQMWIFLDGSMKNTNTVW